ncbi:unnamed protein product [Heterobilharzia americana]|nr:unnamed protein product [Heterobilharzia americana]
MNYTILLQTVVILLLYIQKTKQNDLESIQSKITWLNKKIATNKERRETVRKDIVNTEQQLRGQIRKINGKLALQKESIDKYVKCKKQNCEGEIGYQLMQGLYFL